MRTLSLTVALLALTVGVIRADDDDPEPPGAALSRLRRTWTTVRILTGGRERTATSTYTFEKDRAIYTFGDPDGKGGTYTMSLKADRTRSDRISMHRKGAPRATKYFFEIRKGELYLVPDRS